MKKASFVLVAVSVLGLGLAGCSKQKNAAVPSSSVTAAGTSAAKALPPGHPAISPQTKASGKQPAAYQGTVEETMPAGGYTYAKVHVGDQDVWLAGPKTELAKGDSIGWQKGLVMHDFTSPTLKRTFTNIYFVSSIVKLQGDTPQEGRVAETFNSGGYLYIKVEEKDGTKWLAAPKGDVKKDDKISWQGGELMHNFHSNTLNRTFPVILFVNQVKQG